MRLCRKVECSGELRTKWQFQQGTVIYKIEGPRPGRELYMEQQELIRRVEKVEVG
jgi:hypothetical protein